MRVDRLRAGGASSAALPAADAQRVEGGTIVYAHQQEPQCLFGGWIEQAYISYQFIDNLVSLDENGEVVPWLAESWEASDDGLTYTYTLREGLLWSDGEPLTADDIAWNVNTGRDQEWDNMWSTTQNLDAVAVDDRTLQLTTSVPDPKLPNLGVYILPRHVWEPVATDYEAATQFDPAADVPGSGPFIVTDTADPCASTSDTAT